VVSASKCVSTAAPLQTKVNTALIFKIGLLLLIIVGGVFFFAQDDKDTMSQQNESDLDFIRERASDEEVDVRGFDPETKKEITGQAGDQSTEGSGSGDYMDDIPPSGSTEPDPPLAPEQVWYQDREGWKSNVTLPACPDPLRLETPVDLSLATSVLYPGQYRSGNYKPHGGFRFDTSKIDDIVVTAPADAQIVDGGRVLTGGEIQYTFDFITPCGIWYRFGHIRKLPEKFANIAETFPAAVEGDSRTYEVTPVQFVTAGEVIGTAVGTSHDSNVGFDWGVYDLRSKNSASQDSAWTATHPGMQEQHAVCWFDLLAPEDAQTVWNLPPADGVSGATSDYCI